MRLSQRALVLPLAALAALWMAQLHAASFDCEKATRPVEKLICENGQIGTLDEHLDRYYRAARTTLERGGECLRTQQREWLRTVRDQCADTECLQRVYLARLAQLDALQPGATAIQNIELPRGPQLIAILPPAEDEIAAPRTHDAQRVELRGRIVDAVETGYGFELHDERGVNYLLRPLMFIEAMDAAMLSTAAKEAQTIFLVQGFLNEEEPSALDVSRCAFIYRVPAPQ